MINKCLNWLANDFRKFKKDTRKFKNAFIFLVEGIKEFFGMG